MTTATTRRFFPTEEVLGCLEHAEEVLAESLGHNPCDWPLGWCGETCRAIFPEIKKILKEFQPRLISGFFYVPRGFGDYPWGEHDHVYIQCANGAIIDPTAGQFLHLDAPYAIFLRSDYLHKRYSLCRTGR